MMLAGNVALITGAAQGIGFAIAQRFADEGATVTIADINFDRAEAAAAALPGDHHAMQVDVGDETSVREMVRKVVARSGRLDTLVHCAGITFPTRPLIDTPLNEWNATLHVNLTGTFLCCREAARPMVDLRHGSIINIASVAGILAQKNNTPYGTSKAACAHFTRIAAMDLAEFGVRVNSIAPGPVATPLFNTHSEDIRARYMARIPLGRAAQPSELSGAAVFLASDDSNYMTGHTLVLDGGFSVSGLR